MDVFSRGVDSEPVDSEPAESESAESERLERGGNSSEPSWLLSFMRFQAQTGLATVSRSFSSVSRADLAQHRVVLACDWLKAIRTLPPDSSVPTSGTGKERRIKSWSGSALVPIALGRMHGRFELDCTTIPARMAILASTALVSVRCCADCVHTSFTRPGGCPRPWSGSRSEGSQPPCRCSHFVVGKNRLPMANGERTGIAFGR